MINTCAQVAMLIVFGAIPIVAQDTFQLAPPYLHCKSVFFEKPAQVKLEFAQAGTQIHYTVNGKIPTQNDPDYKGPIRIKKNHTTLKAKVFGAGFFPSEPVEATFFKQGLEIKSIGTTLPHKQYPGSGKFTLIDGLGGIESHGSKTWMGFQSDTVIIILNLAKTQKVKQAMFHFLQNQGAWIFLPQKVEVYALKTNSKEWTLLGQKTVNVADGMEKSRCRDLFVDLEKQESISQVILKIYPLAKLPEWHAGKGNPAWLFIDEVKLY
ncbi:MAG: chitobiase/beta-hexosaminidase C-terminal domain-containing protein [Saprospiraceae bacterium]